MNKPFRFSVWIHVWGYRWRRIVTKFWYSRIFRRVGVGCAFYPFGMLVGTENISVGSGTTIRYGCRLETVEHGQSWRPHLSIGSGVNIEQNVHIICHDRVTIGDRVSITGHCAIVDVTHPFRIDKLVKMGRCIDGARSFVEIGEGSFLGFGTIVLPNVRIGRNCMIGAGSVVVSDIPDYSVAAGSPARVLKRHDIASPDVPD